MKGSSIRVSRHHGDVLVQLGRVFGRGTVSGLSEESLLDRFVSGNDETAFAALVARHGPMVLGVCRRVLRNEHEVEDAFQATFLVFVRRAGAIRDGGLVGPWLYGVAHRVAVRARANVAKRRLREPNVHDADRFDVASASKDDTDDLRGVIDEELARLPDSIRAPIVLCYLEGLTHEEAAARLGWPLGTVRSRMARGRDTLRHRLSRRGINASDASLATVLVRPASLTIPSALVDATVKASLSFQTIAATSAVLASATAVSLAQGVLHAMTLFKLSMLGAVAVSGLVLLGGWQTYGSSSQDEDPQRKTTRSRVTNLESKLETMAAEVKSLRDENRRLQDELKTVKDSAKPSTAMRGGPGMGGAGMMPGMGGGMMGGGMPSSGAGMGGGMPSGVPGMMMGGRGMPGMMGGMGMGMGMGGVGTAPSDPNQPRSVRISDLFVVTSPTGNKVSILDTKTGKARSLTISLSKDAKPRTINPIMGGTGLLALDIQGPEISRIAVYDEGNWFPIELKEPTSSASPIVGDNLVTYAIGRRVYAFSKLNKGWDVVELPRGSTPQPILMSQSVEFTQEGHLYTFHVNRGKWRDSNINPKAILDAPEDQPVNSHSQK